MRSLAIAGILILSLTGCQLPDLLSAAKPPPLSADSKYALAQSRAMLIHNERLVSAALAQESAYHGVPQNFPSESPTQPRMHI